MRSSTSITDFQRFFQEKDSNTQLMNHHDTLLGFTAPDIDTIALSRLLDHEQQLQQQLDFQLQLQQHQHQNQNHQLLLHQQQHNQLQLQQQQPAPQPEADLQTIAQEVLSVLGDDGNDPLLVAPFNFAAGTPATAQADPVPSIALQQNQNELLGSNTGQKREASYNLNSPADPSMPAPKKARVSSPCAQQPMLSGDNLGEGRFRAYQAEQWTERFEELCEFRKKHGHCSVPHEYKESPALARWAKRQRYQYKLKLEGKTSTMTDDRIAALNALGFVWDSHGAVWEERLNELKEYRRVHGHCNVPSLFDSNPKLATWVKCQRRQYKLFVSGKRSNMTMPRVVKLEQLGFVWELRSRSSNL